MADAAIALNRFGIGARPDEAAPADPRGWLTGQFDLYDPRPAPIAAVADSHAVLAAYADAADRARQLRGGPRKVTRTRGAAGDDPDGLAAKMLLKDARNSPLSKSIPCLRRTGG